MRFESRKIFVGVVALLVIGVAAPSFAQDIAVVKLHSLNKVFDSVEAIAQATGQPVDRDMLMGMGLGMLGIQQPEFLDMEKPLAVVMPAEGMMLQQNGVVAAVPVKDAGAAIEALTTLFPTHTSEGELHTFATDQGPVLFLLVTDGYVRFGGNSDLVTRFDPLAGPAPTPAISVEIFLEAIAPMLDAGLQAAKSKVETELKNAPVEEEMPYEPEAISSMLDLYFEGFQSLIASTSSIRIDLDVKDGYVQLSEALIPKKDSPLAGFIAAQKGGLPEIARLADSSSAIYVAGNITLTPELRAGVKNLADRYTEIISTMFDAQPEAESDEEAAEGKTSFWEEYMNAMAPFTEQWIGCMRGDLAGSFDFGSGGPFSFSEAFGMSSGDECQGLLDEMRAALTKAIAENEELSSTFSITEGPKIGDSKAFLMEFDMVSMVESLGQPIDTDASKAMKTIYGEKMEAAASTSGDYLVVAGGEGAAEQLKVLVSSLKGPAKLPSFAPLRDGPGFSMAINLGRFLSGIANIIPEGGEKLAGPAEALSGETGRIPMGIRFNDGEASFELAVSLKTIESIAAIVMEEKAKAMAAEPTEETAVEEGS
jgi:hypothetical protein